MLPKVSFKRRLILILRILFNKGVCFKIHFLNIPKFDEYQDAYIEGCYVENRS